MVERQSFGYIEDRKLDGYEEWSVLEKIENGRSLVHYLDALDGSDGK